MIGEESSERTRRELLERIVVEKVGKVISSIEEATNVDKVIVALYSLAVCLFPLSPESLSGSVDEEYRDELFVVEIPGEDERTEWWNVFYTGSKFRAFAKILLYDVASNWLACFPSSARKLVYDVFFINGCATEIVPVLVPCLQPNGNGHHDSTVVCLNAERLLVLCLVENDLVLQMAREVAGGGQFRDLSREQLRQAISRLLQLITSIPDKARRGAPTSLSPHLFYKRLASQLLLGVEEWDRQTVDEKSVSPRIHMDVTILFVGEAFARISRRGSTDVLLSVAIPQILQHVRSNLLSTPDLDIGKTFESKPGLHFWLEIMDAVNDLHSVERIAEELLLQLSAQNVNDVEGYWILWILFGHIYKRLASVRFTFLEKFLLWKIFPTCCLRWIIQFAVLECSPKSASLKSHNACGLSDTVHRLVLAWSRKEFVQSSSIEQQAYVTAALGLCLEKMAKEDLDRTKDGLHSVLQGISCRLESPVHLIRKMASAIALVFSKIIDPQNPLYLDDSCQEETIDWDFGLASPNKGTLTVTGHGGSEKTGEEENSSTIVSAKDIKMTEDNGVGESSKLRKKFEYDLIDPDEVIDPATLNNYPTADENESDVGSEDSETLSDSSLQPYDLADDDGDLKVKFSQLVDVVSALRKTDDADGVEKALDVAEKLIRASPDELKYIAGDLTKCLVHVRCSDFTPEGEEESAEEKREKALVALIVTRPLESLDNLNKLLYSPNLDISQRIMILDIMTDAAQELASSRILKSEHRLKASLISSTSDQPWFMPKNIGPPGAGSWKEITTTGTPLNWSYSYERELPPKVGQIKRGKTRRWSLRPEKPVNQIEWSRNSFPQYAAAFMLPAMQGYDKKRHGVDLLGRDSIVLGKLIYMLGVCMKCAAMHPEASVLASPLLDMLRSREISHHAEAYVRRSVLFAASCVMVALHPSYVATAVVEGNAEISEGLEWVRTWAMQVADSDTDRECHMLAMSCLQLHAEMALQASRALQSSKDDASSAKSISLFPTVSSRGSIKIPYLNS